MKFREKIERAINQHSMENGSNTPDFILAKYLADCLAAFDKATNARERWYGRSNRGPCSVLVNVPEDVHAENG